MDYGYNRIAFTRGLESGFIESAPEADRRYTPRILSNDEDAGINVLSVLKQELRDCISFDFSVAFLANSGIQTLIPILLDLKERNIPGRIITSTYLDFNEPGALRTLLDYPNIETRVYQGEHHAKGYFFNKDGISTIIIGSSNLTQRALTCNKEWNVLFKTFEQGGLLLEARKQFDELWESDLTARLSPEWIDEYAAHRAQRKPVHATTFKSTKTQQPQTLQSRTPDVDYVSTPLPQARPSLFDSVQPKGTPAADSQTTSDSAISPDQENAQDEITPNKMQSHALEALGLLHDRDEPRALLVSATGTGKTHLSAFDIRETKPERVLFIAHRRRILTASRESFEKVLGDRYSYSVYDGRSPWNSSTCLFAMVGTLSRRLDQIPPDAFDYIVIDEAHRTGAAGYQAILDHFKPKFCLGMTATPSRTDGYDVYGLFNHVIAYRITLKDALNNDMLAPFHYFGIADLEIDDKTVDDLSMFSKLTSEERVRHITQRIEQYTVDKEGRRGLIFCNRVDEAERLSAMFNQRGYRTVAISGASSDAERDAAIARLERGELQYIFSVDILNEGVDIPSLNQIIMLRRTESAIIFIQQLGRGLRKAEGKEYTLVLDFIGNYQNNYLVPIALSGDRTYNKDSLRKAVKEGDTVVPGCSTIAFDRIAEARVFKALEQGKFGKARLIRGEYEHLKQVLGRIPSLLDFDENESIDPMLIIRKYGSYPAFLSKYDPDYKVALSQSKLDMLQLLSKKLANGKRAEDLRVLKRLIATMEPCALEPNAKADRVCAERMESVARVLSGSFSKTPTQLAVFEDGLFKLGGAFKSALGDADFKSCVLDAIEFGLSRNERDYASTYKDTDFVLNAKYTREEVCRLLHWEVEPNFQNVGGYFHDKATNTFPVFIDYQKDPSISITTQYEDRFISDSELIAISKSGRKLDSPEIKSLKNAKSNGMRCFLFVRKNKEDKDDGTLFYFLGEMYPTGDFKLITMQGTTTSAVEISYRLDVPVRPDLLDYFLSDLDVDG